MNIPKKEASKLLAAALILCFAAGSFLNADSLSGKAKAAKEKIQQEAKKLEQKGSSSKQKEKKDSDSKNAKSKKSANTKETKLEALRRKALDAYEFPEQMVAVYKTDRRGKKTLDLKPVDEFCVNKVALTEEDIALLKEWASSPERGGNRYVFANKQPFGQNYADGRWNNCILCNALSELCGLTPVYWTIPDPSEKNMDQDLYQELQEKGFSPIRINYSYSHNWISKYQGDDNGGEDDYYITIMQADGFCLPEKTETEFAIANNSGKQFKGAGEKGIFLVRRRVNSLDSSAGGQ